MELSESNQHLKEGNGKSVLPLLYRFGLNEDYENSMLSG
jgi:hypothetical protein